MTTIYLIRHAEAEGNLYRRIHGWYDALVTENGLRQIQALEQRFQGEHFDAVWSSDLYRTCTTARAVYEPRGLGTGRTDPELRELNMGDWEDQTWGQVRRTQPGSWTASTAATHLDGPPWRGAGGTGGAGGAGPGAASPPPTGQTVAVFSHGTAIRQALARIKGIRRRSGTACATATTPPSPA